MDAHYAYLLACADGTYYAGYTTDPLRRVAEHNDGTGAKYTRGRTPVELAYVERFGSRSAAMSREYELKQLSHAEKERLVTETDVERVLDAGDAEDGEDAGDVDSAGGSDGA